jgi:hypothetical protein
MIPLGKGFVVLGEETLEVLLEVPIVYGVAEGGVDCDQALPRFCSDGDQALELARGIPNTFRKIHDFSPPSFSC